MPKNDKKFSDKGQFSLGNVLSLYLAVTLEKFGTLPVSRSTNKETLPIGQRVATSVRWHAAQSNLVSKVLNVLRAKSAPSFLVNRAAASGLVRAEFEAAMKQAKKWEHLPQIFAAIAGSLHEKAMYWEDLGLQPRAGAHYLQSALWDFYAQLLTTTNPDNRALLYARCCQSYRSAAPYFEYPARQIEMPFQAGTLKGYLRLPGSEAEKPAPCVILVSNTNSTKEELHYTENAFLRMGLATLSFDLPGFGESLEDHLDSCDFEMLGNTLFLFLAQHQEINPERTALHGLGIGGAVALNLALVFENRYKAVATLSSPLNLRATLSRLLPAVRREAVSLTHGVEQLLRDFSRRTVCSADLQTLNCPLLVAGGGRDILAPAADTKQIYESAGSSDKKLLLIPNAGHGCYEMMPSLRYEIAQWIRQRI